MKKRITTLLTALSLMMMLAVPGMAAAAPTPAPTKTQVSGVVTNGSKPVKHAHISVVCGHFGRTTQTDGAGQYSVTFKASECPLGSTVTVVATKSGFGGLNHGMVNTGTVKLNVAIVNVSVPELGLFTGAGAAIAAGAGFMVIRRRQTAGLNA